MSNIEKIVTTPSTETKTPDATIGSNMTPTAMEIKNTLTGAKEQEQNSHSLDNYLVSGYYKGSGKIKYTDPALIDQAEQIAASLAVGGVNPSAFNRMVKTLKSAAKLPYEAQQGALKKLFPQVLEQERKKKAPPLLREIVERNREAVKTPEDYAACLEHFRDICIYL